MRILIIEPFMVESHSAWAEDYSRFSAHEVRILGLNGVHWKWRMHGGAITLAKRYTELDWKPDLILASDMIDLALFSSLLRRELQGVKIAIYFHENQLTYPWSEKDEDARQGTDLHYAFINYSSALVADRVYFNSIFHKESFLKALPDFLKIYPDHQNLNTVELIADKAEVLPLGMDLSFIDECREEAASKPWPKRASILWNHRWEYDKGPEEFFRAVFELKDRGVEFRLSVAGRSFDRRPKIFEEAKSRLAENIDCFGFIEDRKDYAITLLQSDILPVTSIQDFFGLSVVEATYADAFPLLPKRLAYPEHFPEAYHSTFFYKDERDLINRLQRLIFDVKVIRKQKTRQFVENYDWSSMSSRYDDRFFQLHSS